MWKQTQFSIAVQHEMKNYKEEKEKEEEEEGKQEEWDLHAWAEPNYTSNYNRQLKLCMWIIEVNG
jgi:hypothetical protein